MEDHGDKVDAMSQVSVKPMGQTLSRLLDRAVDHVFLLLRDDGHNTVNNQKKKCLGPKSTDGCTAGEAGGGAKNCVCYDSVLVTGGPKWKAHALAAPAALAKFENMLGATQDKLTQAEHAAALGPKTEEQNSETDTQEKQGKATEGTTTHSTHTEDRTKKNTAPPSSTRKGDSTGPEVNNDAEQQTSRTETTQKWHAAVAMALASHART
ncbi:hypothetical protein ERJ75_001111100 [Trypanosoma vivax]|nr:hypothetical protein ERJ75_001111100 [Trypanosoma vivax]